MSDPTVDPICDRCDQGAPQDAKHIIAECDADMGQLVIVYYQLH